MEDIGHLEFGALHRPIAFPAFGGLSEGLDPSGIDYWLAYWIAAFEHIAMLGTGIRFVSHEHLSAGGSSGLAQLCAAVGLQPGDHLDAMASEFRPLPDRAGEQVADPRLRERADAGYAGLLSGRA